MTRVGSAEMGPHCQKETRPASERGKRSGGGNADLCACVYDMFFFGRIIWEEITALTGGQEICGEISEARAKQTGPKQMVPGSPGSWRRAALG